MHVSIDGVEYAPVGKGGGPRVGVAVTTHNRPEVLARTLDHIMARTPGAVVVVVDDGSKVPVTVPDGVVLVRHEKARGIAGAKNACLAALMAEGVDHLFLFDDDAWPVVDDWWRPYVESPEPHLMAMFDRPKGVTKRQIEILYDDGVHEAYHATRGHMLYVERRVVEAVGGMNPAFGAYGWEHVSWSDRIHSAGFTTGRYMGIKGAGDDIYSMDREGEIQSTATDEARRFSTGPGLELRMQSRHSTEYIEYRDLRNVVMTSLLTAQSDPQRGRPMQASASMLKVLHDSLKHDGEFIVAHTGIADGDTLDKASMVEVVQHINPYFQRWINYFQWLRGNPDVGFVWCVDGTDVTMTRDPFPEMESGVLYMGYEAKTLRDEWMMAHHPDKTLQDFMTANANTPLLNMGVVGGDRATVMEFAQRVIKFYFDDHNDWIMGWETKRAFDGVSGDMATGNYVARKFFADRVSSGPHVTNAFKSKLGVECAWWAHKAVG